MRLPLVLSSACLALALTGCGMGTTASNLTSNGLAITGQAYGGQAPISGAHVYLFYASTAGYNQASTSLLNPVATGNADSLGAYVLTNAQGNFTITNDYQCQTGYNVYLYVQGGNAGSGVNSAASEMAMLGQCPGTNSFVTTVPFLQVNEVTTVAAAYAMAGFATDSTHVSAANTTQSKLGLANAFNNAANLANVGTGVALTTTPNGNGVVPAATINTVADVIAACINSTGPTSVQCTTLFNAARSAGVSGTLPTDTASAAINIAHFPGANTATLVGLLSAASPFQPTVSNPNDLSIGIAFSGAGVNDPYTIAIDAAGAAWTANGAGNGGVSKFSPLGVPLSGATTSYTGGGVGAPNAVAIDPNGNAWAVNGVGNLAKFNASGVALSPSTGFNPSGAGTQLGLAIDGNGNVWTANFNNPSGVDETSNGGAVVTGFAAQPYTSGGISFPIGVAIAADNGVWIGNYAGNTGQSLTHLSVTGAPATPNPYTGGGLAGPHGVAIDANGYIWTANYSNNTLSKFSPSGTPASTSTGYTGGGLSNPTSIAVDGSGTIFACSTSNNSVSAFTNGGTAISGTNGYTSGSLNAPQGVAIDPSGNVWVANSNGNTVTEMIGMAAPVVTPLAAAVAANTIGTKP